MSETSKSSQNNSEGAPIKSPTGRPKAALAIQIKKLSPEAKLPTKVDRDIPDAGWDLYSNVSVRVPGGAKMTVKTGIALAIPKGWYGNIRAKSGIASSTPLMVDAGIVDPGYRGEIMVVLANNSEYPFDVLKGTKIAQMLFEPIQEVTFTEVTDLPPSDRGTNGFGSTGA
jgi:dUTP pyrophosphatase